MLAPQVYEFNRNLGRQGGPTMSPLRRAVDVAGKTALGLGAIAGAAYLGKQFLTPGAGSSDGAETPGPEGVTKLLPPAAGEISTGVSMGAPAPTAPVQRGITTEQKIAALGKAKASPRPRGYREDVEADVYDTGVMDAYVQHQWQSHRRNVSERVQEYLTQVPSSFGGLEIDNEVDLGPVAESVISDPGAQTVRASGDITPPTTSQRYNQTLLPKQTAAVRTAEGLSSAKPTYTPIEDKPVTQSEVIGTQQSFSPGSEMEMVGEDTARKAEAFRKSATYAAMQKQYPGMETIESPSQPASSAPVVLTGVKPAPSVRPTSAVAVKAEPSAAPREMPSPIQGARSSEVRELDALLARSMAGKSPEERMSVRDQMLAKKYGSSPDVAPKVETPTVIKAEPTGESVRFAREAARGVSRMGLMARQEAGRSATASRAMFGKEEQGPTMTEASGELADPRVMREMLRRPAPAAIPNFL